MSIPWSVEMYIFEEPFRAQQPEISARHQDFQAPFAAVAGDVFVGLGELSRKLVNFRTLTWQSSQGESKDGSDNPPSF